MTKCSEAIEVVRRILALEQQLETENRLLDAVLGVEGAESVSAEATPCADGVPVKPRRMIIGARSMVSAPHVQSPATSIKVAQEEEQGLSLTYRVLREVVRSPRPLTKQAIAAELKDSVKRVGASLNTLSSKRSEVEHLHDGLYQATEKGRAKVAKKEAKLAEELKS